MFRRLRDWIKRILGRPVQNPLVPILPPVVVKLLWDDIDYLEVGEEIGFVELGVTDPSKVRVGKIMKLEPFGVTPKNIHICWNDTPTLVYVYSVREIIDLLVRVIPMTPTPPTPHAQ